MSKETSTEKPKRMEEIRVGVFVCHHGTHIGSVINFDELTTAGAAKACNIGLSSQSFSALMEGSVNHRENNI